MFFRLHGLWIAQHTISPVRLSGEKAHLDLEVVHLAIILRDEAFLAKGFFDNL
jgi:hypothetical protein